MHAVSDEGSWSMVAAVPASQVGRDCGRVAVVEPVPQRRRLKLLGRSQYTTVGGHVLRSGGPSALTFLGAGSSVPPTEMPGAVDISTPRDRREGMLEQDLSAPSCSRHSFRAGRWAEVYHRDRTSPNFDPRLHRGRR